MGCSKFFVLLQPFFYLFCYFGYSVSEKIFICAKPELRAGKYGKLRYIYALCFDIRVFFYKTVILFFLIVISQNERLCICAPVI